MTSFFSGPITGKKFFAIFVSFFLVIAAVNIALAVNAIRTFPGLETKNSYVASQSFDRDRAAQNALGWTVDAHTEASELVLSITDRDGAPVQVSSLDGTFGRATSVRDDQTPVFEFDGTVYRAPVTLAPGNWNFRMVAQAEDGTRFRQRVIVHIED